MRIYQDRELIRMGDMLSSQDKEMRLLGKQLLYRNKFQFNYSTIVFFHAFLLNIILTLYAYVIKRYGGDLGWYWLPVISSLMMYIVWTIFYIIKLDDFRSKYNKEV